MDRRYASCQGRRANSRPFLAVQPGNHSNGQPSQPDIPNSVVVAFILAVTDNCLVELSRREVMSGTVNPVNYLSLEQS